MTQEKLKKINETDQVIENETSEKTIKKSRAKKVAEEKTEKVEEKKSTKKEKIEKTETNETETNETKVSKEKEKVEIKKVDDSKKSETSESEDIEDEDPNAITFAKLWIKWKILDNLLAHKIITPTPIQAWVIPPALEWKHIVGQSNTGTWKTAWFVLPLLQKIDPKKRAVQAIIIAPTRELANQIREDVYNYSSNIWTRSLAVYGNSNIFKQREILQRWVQIVVWTPWRLIDLIDRRYMRVDQVQTVVLDEVDKMLDMGFVDDIKYLLETLPHQQLMTFSATITPEINRIIEQFTGNEYEFVKTSVDVNIDKLNHAYMAIHHTQKYDKLKKYLDENKDKKVIIFTQTKINTQNLLDKLLDDWYDVWALHWDMHQRDRFNTIKDMKSWDLKTLIATDVASRGLNLNDIALVINYDVPQDPESYVHRIGRTARAWAEWEAIMFVSASEFNSVRAIERTNKIKIKEIDEYGKEIIKKLVERAIRWNDRNDRYARNRYWNSRGGYGRNSGSKYGRNDRNDRWGYKNESNNSERSYDKFSSTKSGERTGYYAQKDSFEKNNRNDRPRNDRPRNERSYDRNWWEKRYWSDKVETWNYWRNDRSRSRYARKG